MENEKKNNVTKQKKRPEEIMKKNGRHITAVILTLALMTGSLTGCVAGKTSSGENEEKTAEEGNIVTTVTSDKANETKETEKITTAETTVETTVPETEKATELVTAVTPVSAPETAVSFTSLDAAKNSPIRNKNHVVYSDILAVLPELESFNCEFSPFVYDRNNEPEYRDIVVGADVTYSCRAMKPIESDSFKPFGGTLHSKKYYKVSKLVSDLNYKYKTEEDVRSALEDYFTDSFIENHFISYYDEVPGRYTLFKIIDGELYVTSSDDLGMMVPAYGNVYNFDGKRCDVDTRDYSPDIHSDPMHVSLVLEDEKWKIDGYEHTGNIPDAAPAGSGQYDDYNDIGKKAVEDLKLLEGVVFCVGVAADENDTLNEEYDGISVEYKRVTDERFSNVSEVENYICGLASADLRLRCIDHIRGADGKYPVYTMSGDALYCRTEEFNKFYCLPEYSKVFSVISADDNSVQLAIDEYNQTHNCLFLKNTEDGWKLSDLD